MKLALIQTTSGADVAANIAAIEPMVKAAAAQGAQLIALPENAFYMRAQGEEPTQRYGMDDHPGVIASRKWAKELGVWILAGSVGIKGSGVRGQGPGKVYNRSLLINPQGAIAAQYDKIHLFDVEVGDGQKYQESARILPGDRAVVVEMDVESWRCGDVEKKANSSSPHIPTSPHPKLGLTICYDLRFPQLFRALAQAGAAIITVPSAFTVPTGEAHWHVLLRARAIEDACFIVAPAQCGAHPGGRRTYGRSLVVDPWGRIIAERAEDTPGVLMAELDLAEVERVRTKLPSLQHDRKFDEA